MATPSPATAHPRRSLDGVRCTGIEAHDLPSGRSVYIYALEITLRSGAVILAKRRYSAWRDLHTEVRDLHTFGSGPDRPLPPFPDKASFSRQTPSFLAARAKALARYVCCLFPAALCARGCSPVYPGCEPMHPRYVAAVLADPVLAGLPAVVALYSGGGGPGFAPGSLDSAFDSALDSTPGSAASTPAARQYQHTPIQSALLPGATPPARSLAAPPATTPAPSLAPSPLASETISVLFFHSVLQSSPIGSVLSFWNDSQDLDLCFLIVLLLRYLESVLRVLLSIPMSMLPEVVTRVFA